MSPTVCLTYFYALLHPHKRAVESCRASGRRRRGKPGRRPEIRSCREGGSLKPIPDPLTLPPTFPVQTASLILGIGRNRTYELIKSGNYPVRVIDSGGRHRVSRWDLLKYLGATPDDSGARNQQPLPTR